MSSYQEKKKLQGIPKCTTNKQTKKRTIWRERASVRPDKARMLKFPQELKTTMIRAPMEKVDQMQEKMSTVSRERKS